MNKVSSDKLYDEIISILTHIKLVYGPSYVVGALRRRPYIKQFIATHQSEVLDSIEYELYNENSE